MIMKVISHKVKICRNSIKNNNYLIFKNNIYKILIMLSTETEDI